VPALYRLAAKSRGVFVNPALTEPFGLTLLEAGASGVPIVATEDGGPRDIIGNCRNGVLIDPLDADAMGAALIKVLSNRSQWSNWSKAGLAGVRKFYSWDAHIGRYMREIKKVVNRPRHLMRDAGVKGKLVTADRVLICDLDNTLVGDEESLKKLLVLLRDAGSKVAFGIATGRQLDSTLKVLRDWQVPLPDFLITSVGTEIRYGPQLILDTAWQQHNDYRWTPQAIRVAMRALPGVKLQARDEQGTHKISYVVDNRKAPPVRDISRHLRKQNLHVNIIYSHEAYLDIVPVRASKGGAVRHVSVKWGIPVESMLVVGDAGNDEDMLSGNTLGVVVSNHSPELAKLRGRERIYFAAGHHAWGILEAIEHYDFFHSLRPRDDVENAELEVAS
jgi:sucrose-phosphate synthase